jgi:signal transduction histidine kinase
MGSTTNTELEAKIAWLSEALSKADERATAGQLALEMVHDIRNPLEALANLLYLSELEAADSKAVRKYLALADEQILTVTKIATQTLTFAKSIRSTEASNLVRVAEAALRIHQRTIQAKRVHLVKDLPEELVAEIHTSEILQVFSNVIVNALDALPPEGTLCLRLRKRQNEIQCLIADNGHGIPKEHLGEIFQPFFTMKQEHGTGLGLVLSKNIVERHRGKIQLRTSVRPGKSGTVFKISLPA